jgi:hypothetical protein
MANLSKIIDVHSHPILPFGEDALAHRSDGRLASAPNFCLLITRPQYRCPTIPLA